MPTLGLERFKFYPHMYKGEGKGGPNPRKGGVRDKALTPPFSNVPGNGHSVRQTNPPNDTKIYSLLMSP